MAVGPPSIPHPIRERTQDSYLGLVDLHSLDECGELALTSVQPAILTRLLGEVLGVLQVCLH